MAELNPTPTITRIAILRLLVLTPLPIPEMFWLFGRRCLRLSRLQQPRRYSTQYHASGSKALLTEAYFQTTSTRSSAITPVSPTAPPPSFACPADDIQQLQENGQNYYVGCGMVAQGTTSAAYIATNSWNDCFGEHTCTESLIGSF